MRLPAALTANKLATLELAAIAVVVIALLNAAFSYAEKYATTSAGQWIVHDFAGRSITIFSTFHWDSTCRNVPGI